MLQGREVVVMGGEKEKNALLGCVEPCTCNCISCVRLVTNINILFRSLRQRKPILDYLCNFKPINEDNR